MRHLARIPLSADGLTGAETLVLDAGTLSASLFRYPSGIAALRLSNARGSLIVLPWFGQMLWHVVFDGVDLTMRSFFDAPLPSDDIAGTYGCFAFHSGLLRNGVPGPGDDHAAHGEFPCASMRDAWLDLFDENGTLALRLTSERDHAVGFGPHYLAHPFVTLREHSALFDLALDVENRSGKPMELMYMAHVNFAFVPGGEIVQPVPYDPHHVAVRRAIPGHVVASDAYRARIETLAADPGRMRRLDETGAYDPEQVFYLDHMPADADGRASLMLRRPDGDAFALRYAPAQFPHCVRWILDDPDQGVAAFALPSTCHPEGYLSERAKGHVRILPPHGHASFAITLGYLSATEFATTT